MLVVLGFYRRKPGLSHQEFSDYWTNVHGPMLRDHPDIAPHIKYYVQHHLEPNPSGDVRDVGFDGFSEAWYDSAEDRARVVQSAAFQAIREDEAMFIDLTQTRVSVIDTQRVIIDNR
ncbi:EthD domain-containing protein [Sphingobium chlorophenolicum]|uniref:Ethyl tert-butyl ether degradation EthD n=1 Tax=Sphingobium chlorophenolicum TaxID=46429 RepID=A0A081RC00_SPHCR|nr:EthD domain-containing protein [Sphingobium chlorophenolicum]KEQ52723.1 Ethyl tert-butyl ether degradation EthD [Sphingobium chlorophenolicum]